MAVLQIGCFARLGISEENARFVLLSIIILLYLTIGALIFYHLEHSNELKEREEVVLLCVVVFFFLNIIFCSMLHE